MSDIVGIITARAQSAGWAVDVSHSPLQAEAIAFEFTQHTPLGDTVHIAVSGKSLSEIVDGVLEHWMNFDRREYVKQKRKQKTYDVDGVVSLIQDAQEINQMIGSLWHALKEPDLKEE